VEGEHEPMEEGQARATVKKLGHMGTAIERIMPGLPRLQGGSWPLKLLGRLALGDTLCVSVEIVLEHVGPLEAVPELMAVEIVAVWKIDYSAHGSLSLKPSPHHE
jgi:hypothetical protein